MITNFDPTTDRLVYDLTANTILAFSELRPVISEIRRDAADYRTNLAAVFGITNVVPHTHNKTWSQAVTRDGVCEYLPWTPPARCKVTARALMVIACRVRR